MDSREYWFYCTAIDRTNLWHDLAKGRIGNIIYNIILELCFAQHRYDIVMFDDLKEIQSDMIHLFIKLIILAIIL